MSNDAIEEFLKGDAFAVAGASTDRDKYGNKVLRCYQQKGRKVYPLNPQADTVEGLKAYASLSDLPAAVHGLSIVTPPSVSEQVIQQALDLGIRHVWLQPGAENQRAIELAEEGKMNVIHSGPCLLVVLGYREE